MSAPCWGKAGLSAGLLEKELVRHPGTSPPCLPNWQELTAAARKHGSGTAISRRVSPGAARLKTQRALAVSSGKTPCVERGFGVNGGSCERPREQGQVAAACQQEPATARKAWVTREK